VTPYPPRSSRHRFRTVTPDERDLSHSQEMTPTLRSVANDLDVLEATFMIRRLPPYHANVQKRLTKSAELYVRDSGLLHFLAGLRAPAELETWPRRGASFEGLAIEELAGWAAERFVRPGIFFWRTHAGAEVDLLIVDGRRIGKAIEILPWRSVARGEEDIA